MSSPLFPYEGSTFFIETEGDQSHIEAFAKNDPYVKNKIVEKYSIKEFDITIKKRFDRVSG
jgi:uncharacterized protein YciI